MSWEGGSARVFKLLAPLLAAVFWGSPAVAAKIACVGDSITYGYGLGDPATESYPAVLQSILGSEHTVENFGVSGCTVLRQGDKPYWNESAYTSSTSFAPDLVIILLGTNDTKPQNWQYQAEFVTDYTALVEHYQTLGARVYAALPTPVYGTGAFDISPQVLSEQVVPLVQQAAVETGAPQIDLFTELSGQASLFPDTVHPNAAGARLIAETVAAALVRDGMGAAGAGGAGGAGGGDAAGGGAAAAPSSGGGAALGGSGGVGGGGQAAVGGGLVTGGSGGGAPVGGTSAATGGTASSGGSSGGGAATPATGGSGGVPATGGAMVASGGLESSGGTGGSSLPGGGNATGGASAPAVTGGALATGLGGSDPTSASGDPGEDDGCGCHVSGQAPAPSSLLLGVALLFLLRRSRTTTTSR